MFRNNIFWKKAGRQEEDLWFWYTGFLPPAHFFSPRVQQTLTEEEKKPASDEFVKKIFQNASVGSRVLKVLYCTYFQILVFFFFPHWDTGTRCLARLIIRKLSRCSPRIYLSMFWRRCFVGPPTWFGWGQRRGWDPRFWESICDFCNLLIYQLIFEILLFNRLNKGRKCKNAKTRLKMTMISYFLCDLNCELNGVQ